MDLPSTGEQLARPCRPRTQRAVDLRLRASLRRLGSARVPSCPGMGAAELPLLLTPRQLWGSGEHGCMSLVERPHPSQSAVLSPLNGFQSQGSGGPHARPCPSPLIPRLEVPFPSHAVPPCPAPGANQKCPMESVMWPLPPGTQRTSSPTPSSPVGPPRLVPADGYRKESPVATARLAPKPPPSSTVPWPLLDTGIQWETPRPWENRPWVLE